MLTPLEAIMGLLLAMSPAWDGLPPAFPPPEATASGSVERAAIPSSFLELSDEELRRVVAADPSSLGSLSIGAPGGGILLNPVSLPESPRWQVAPGAELWGTAETISAIKVVIDTVHELFPGTQPVYVGDISDSDGGRLKRHETHQAGRDVDFGFYYKDRTGPWYAPGTAANLDLPRNWALVRALLTRTDVETILLDTRIQKLLHKYALSIGEDREWLDRVFQFPRGSKDAIIRHVRLHRTHYHVRFYNPVAQELGRRAHPMLVEAKVIEPPVFSVRHVVRNGQTLGHLARLYGTSVRAIQQANGLRGTMLRAGRAYRIPVRGVAPPSQRLVVPRRMLPPTTPEAVAAVDWPTVDSLYGPDAGR
ncbi:MAG: penicillin-insensitive murein endopeptidase [Vicinamibacterales bacterium]